MPVSGSDIAASLFADHEKPLRSYVQRLVPCFERSHTESVVRETFSRTIHDLGKGKSIDPLEGFLYKTALNITTSVLFVEYEKPLRLYVQQRVPGYEPAHADDVVQETFIRTIQHLSKGKAVDSPKGFLFTTARNLITSMFYRGRKHTDTHSAPYMDDFTSPICGDAPEHRLMLQQKLDAFCVAIAALPKRYQEAFVRRRVWGESCREISDAMQLSEKAVANYTALGWKRLLVYCEKHNIVLNDFDDLK